MSALPLYSMTVHMPLPAVFVVIKRDVGRPSVHWMALAEDGVRLDRPLSTSLAATNRYRYAGTAYEARMAVGLKSNRHPLEIYSGHYPDGFNLVEVSADYPLTEDMCERFEAAKAAFALRRDT